MMSFRAGRLLLLAVAPWLVLTACHPEEVSLTPAEELERQGDQAYAGQSMAVAIESYQSALQSGSRTTRLHNNLGNALFKEQRYNAAEQSYLKALELDPGYLFSLNNLALTIYRAEEKERAYSLIDEALKTFPSISFLHTSKGYFTFLDGRAEDSLEAFRKAVEINPDSPAALNNLGVLYLENPDLGEDPLPYLLRAIEKDGENKIFHDSLGWYYFKKGMFAEATIEIGQAFLYDPQNLEVRVHYATVLEWIGKDQESLEQWEKILEIADDSAVRKKALKHFWEIRGREAGGKD